MIIPSRWFTDGKGLDKFREEMLNDKRIRILHDFFNAREVFPGVEIKGGVCYFLWERDNPGNCKVVSHNEGKIISEMERPLLEEGTDVFIRYNEAVSILKKILSKKEKSFSDIVRPRKPFGLPTNFKDFKEKEFENSIKLYANQKIGFIKKEQVIRNKNWINKYKIYVPEAIGVGDITKDIIKPIFGDKNTICTETYVMNGPYETKEEAENVMNYIKTKFFHFMLGLAKNTQHTTQKVYQFVPLQDFTSHSDIDWSKPIPEVDKQLYKKYGLTKEEIDFIESMIKPME